MDTLPQKPLITRPPGVPLPEASRSLLSRRRRQSGTSGKGLLGSIGIHLGIALIAGAVVLTGQGSADKDSGKTAESIPQYEMSLSSKQIPELPTPTKIERPTTFFTSVPTPITVFPELISTVILPPSDPIQSVTTPQVVPPPSPTNSGKTDSSKTAPPTTGTSTGHSPSKSPGQGQTATRKQTATPPKLLQAPPPRYPTKAKAAKITGMTAVLIRVTGNGSAGSTSLYHSSGNTELDQAAIVAARGWKFTPTPSLTNGETIPVLVHVTFSL